MRRARRSVILEPMSDPSLHSPRTVRLLGLALGLVMGAGLALGLAAWGQDDAPPRAPEPGVGPLFQPVVKSAGTGKHLWVARAVEGQFTLLHRHAEFEPGVLYEVRQLDAMPVALAAHEDDLYLVYADGRLHGIGYRYDPPRGVPPYHATTHPPVPIRESERLLDIKAGQRDVFAMLAGPTTDDAPNGALRLLRKQGLDWKPVELPADLTPGDEPAIAMPDAHTEQLALTWRGERDGRSVLHVWSARTGQSETYDIDVRTGYQLTAAMQHAVVVDRHGNAWRVRALRDGGAVALARPDPTQIGKRTVQAVGRGETVELLLIDAAGDLASVRIDPQAPANANPPIKPLTVQPRPAIEMEFGTVLMIAVVGFTTLILLSNWRRDPTANVVRLSAEWEACDLPRRFFAGAIDLAPAAIVSWLWCGLDSPLDVFEHWPVSGGEWTDMKPGVIAIVVFLLHTAFSELFTARTLGKALTGCRILANTGRPADLWQVLGRNAIKALEIIVPMLLILVVLSPYRQRLGDVIGRTVVVRKAEPKPEDENEQNNS